MAIRCWNTPGRVPSNASEHSLNISMIRLSGSAPPAEVHLKLPSLRARAADSPPIPFELPPLTRMMIGSASLPD
jgi:hypothetical protein